MLYCLFFLLSYNVQAINRLNNYATSKASLLASTNHSILTNSNGLVNYTCDSVEYIDWAKNGRYQGKCVVTTEADHGSFTRNNGAKVRLNFIGSKLHILAWKQENSGKVNVWIDNKLVGNPNFNSGGGRHEGIVFTSDDLKYGSHTLEIEHNDTDDAKSMVFGGVYVDPLPKDGGYKLSFEHFGERVGVWTQNTQSTIPSFSCDNQDCSGAFHFYGTRFWLTGVRSSSEGNLKITIDDKQPITISKTVESRFTIAQGNSGVLFYMSDNLGLGFHKVKVERSNQRITLNNLYFTQTEDGSQPPLPTVNTTVMTNPTGLINLTCDKFQYKGWEDGGRGGICITKGDADHGSFTRNTNAVASLNFIGSQVHILAWKQENSGNAKIRIDGQQVSITNFNSGGGRKPGMVFTSNPLPFGNHLLEIQHNDTLNAKSVVIGSAYVNPLPYYGGYSLGLEGLTKRYGQWSVNTETTPPTFGCSSEGCAGTFTFYGTRFWITGMRGQNVGNFEISIDGERIRAVENSKPNGIAQGNIPVLLYQSDELSFKEHNVRIFKTNNDVKFVNFFYTIFPYARIPDGTPTPNPVATPAVDPSPEEINVNTEDRNSLTTDKRFEKEVDDYKSVVAVLASDCSFSNVFSDDKGGAIHVVNCGLKCQGVNFNNCESKEGGGGGIFYDNKYNYETSVELINLKFTKCKAQYGGGIYLYSDSSKNQPIIRDCEFVETEAKATKNNKVDGKFGGSGLYITTPSAVVSGLKYNGCKGENVVTFHNMFNGAVSNYNILSGESRPYIVSNCQFSIGEEASCAIFFLLGKMAAPIEISTCTFKGQLKKGQFFIDGIVENKLSPKMVVKKCKFASGADGVFNNKNSDFLAIDLNDQVFNFIEKSAIKKLSDNWKILVAIIVPAVFAAIIAVVALVIVLKKRKNPNALDENQVINTDEKTLNAALL